MPVVDYGELEAAMMFVSGVSLFDASARISRETGSIYWLSDEAGDDEMLPDDIDDEERYVEVPGQRDLDLGKALVLDFAGRELPEHYGEVRAMFRRKGAYANFKDLLARLGILDSWYRFEQEAVCSALCEWARDEGFEVTGLPDDAAE
jgi:hypothetical protein